MRETVLITGASSGIGKAFAFKYAKMGKNLILTARSKDKLDKIKEEIKKKFSVDIKVFIKDLSKEYSAKELYEEIKNNNLQVDILINNAGFGTSGKFHEKEFSSQHGQIILNCLSLADLTYFILKEMAERKSGTIINVASTVAFQAVPYMAVYGATKAFVLSFSEALYQEYKEYGIKVTAICPGATETGFFDTVGPVGLGKYRTADMVTETAIKAAGKNRQFAVDGIKNYMVTLLSRFLTRKKTTEISGKILKKSLNAM